MTKIDHPIYLKRFLEVFNAISVDITQIISPII